ncbi:MAG: peptidylprolyl isomerase [Chthoniobacterales bacterium]
MKHFLFALLLISTPLATSTRVLAQAEVVDGIAAVVNGEVITYSQVRELIGARERALRDAFRGEELENKIKEMRLAALKDLIDRQLILQEFEEKGLNIPPYLIDDRVKTIIREEFGGDRAAFVRTLKSQGYTITKFKEIEMEKIIVQAMRQTFVKDDFVISPTQIQAYYDKNMEGYSTPEQIKLRMIVIREGGGDGLPGGEQAMASEIRGKLIEGTDFGTLAQMYSEDPTTKETGGDWGWIDKKTLSEPLTNAAFALRAGEISDVITVGNSFYVMMVEARKNADVRSITDVRDEIEQNLIQQEKGKRLQQWIDGLREQAYIKIFS